MRLFWVFRWVEKNGGEPLKAIHRLWGRVTKLQHSTRGHLNIKLKLCCVYKHGYNRPGTDRQSQGQLINQSSVLGRPRKIETQSPKLSPPFIRDKRCNEVLHIRIKTSLCFWPGCSAHESFDQPPPSSPSHLRLIVANRSTTWLARVKLVNHLCEPAKTA